MTDKIQMIAGDTLHISSMQAEPLRAGDRFEVDNEADATRLEAAGHKRATVSSRSEPAKKPARKPSKAS